MVSARMGKVGVGMVISGSLLPRHGFLHPCWSWLGGKIHFQPGQSTAVV